MPTTDALAGIRAKIDRANHHFGDYPEAVAQLTTANAGIVQYRENSKDGKREYFLAKDPVVPTMFSIITGDIVQNLRGALDYLAYALCHGGGQSITPEQVKGIYFPIAKSDKDLPSLLKKYLQGLPKPAAIEAIKRIEPYGNGKGAILSSLHRLSIIDKHRLLLTVALQPPAVGMAGFLTASLAQHFDKPTVAELEAMASAFNFAVVPADQRPIKGGDVMFTEFVKDVGPHGIDFRFPIALNEPDVIPVQPLVPLAQQMIGFVAGLVPTLEPFL